MIVPQSYVVALLMAVLTILFFAIQFFQYYGLIQKPK